MIKFTKTGLLFALVLSCAACTWSNPFSSKKVDYGTATTAKLPPLEVPPDLSKPKTEGRFELPDSKGTSYSSYQQERGVVPTRLGGPDVLPVFDKSHIEREGSERWLVVPGAPEQVWPVVKEFWLSQAFTLTVDDPSAGVMETDWGENRAKIPQDLVRKFIGRFLDNLYSSDQRDKFRTRLERGIEPGTTEIYISHRGLEEVYTNQFQDQTAWQPRPPDPGLEAEMLTRLLVKFGVKEERAQTIVAQESKITDRARIVVNKDGSSILEVSDPFDRAWRRVGLALDRVGFTVEDRDRIKGLYFVRYVDPEIDQKQNEKSFWKKLFSSAPDKNAQRYRIEVKDQKEKSQVEVQANDGSPDKTATGKKILALLQDQLR